MPSRWRSGTTAIGAKDLDQVRLHAARTEGLL